MNGLLLDGLSKVEGLMKKTGPFGTEVDSFVAKKETRAFEVPFDLLE